MLMSSAQSSSHKLIETELYRKKLYDQIRANVTSMKLRCEDGRLLNWKENSNLIMRYLFNKIITRQTNDDPVFIETSSDQAQKQLTEDFAYHHIVSHNSNYLYTQLNEWFIKARKSVKNTQISDDDNVIHDQQKNVLIYKGMEYPDISHLVKQYPSNVNEALALNIRYNYLRLATYGLANDYQSLGFSPDDDVAEAFASAFNHYFHTFYSAFPDLEACFGSKGSFFETDTVANSIIQINPPFDLLLLYCVINKAKKLLQSNKDKQKIILTLPGWKDVKEFSALRDDPMCRKFEIISKDKTSFINHMTGEKIQPCDIISVELANFC